MEFFKLPQYELIMWLNYDEPGKKLENKILPILNGYQVCDNLEVKGIKICNWSIPSWEESLKLGEKLKRFTKDPNVMCLKLKANNNRSIKDIVLKDKRMISAK